MGYSPAVIGLSYVPQTIAFLIGGYGCRAALQKWQGYQLLPWLLGLYALSVIATWGAGLLNNASLVEILIPFCVMAIANGAIYPIVVAQALRPSSSHGALRRYKIRCNWGYVSWQAWWFHGSSARRC